MGTNRRPREEAESEKDEEIFEVVDVEDWEAAIRDVRPLSDRGEGDTRAELPEVGLAERLKERQERSAGSPEASLFNLDRRTTERLKRGQIPIEAQLDLHGFAQLAVEGGKGLVEEQEFGLYGEGARHSDALLLSA